MKRRLICWLFFTAVCCGFIGHLWLRETGRIRLTAPPPPQMTVGDTATLEFSVQNAKDCRAVSSDPAVAEIAVISAQNNRLRCRVTALADGSASLSCAVNEKSSPAYAVSVVAPLASAPAAGAFVASESGKKYHLSTCAYAKKLKTRIFFETAADAESQGYAPCKTCLAPN